MSSGFISKHTMEEDEERTFRIIYERLLRVLTKAKPLSRSPWKYEKQESSSDDDVSVMHIMELIESIEV